MVNIEAPELDIYRPHLAIPFSMPAAAPEGS